MTVNNEALIAVEREKFLSSLKESGTLSTWRGVVSIADCGNNVSKGISLMVARALDAPEMKKEPGQTLGAKFEGIVADFLKATFTKLQHVRPGIWRVMKLGNRNPLKMSSFSQYDHLDYLQGLVKADRTLASIMGTDYLVAPDIVIYRELLNEMELNSPEPIVDETVAGLADLRASNGGKPILHASVSAKLTIRSDRAQNSRTEALNLIRNRKGPLPHIVAVTAEPLPSRLSSLALGTGDIDCVYHAFLYELGNATERYAAECGNDDVLESLDTLIASRRLKDISDLPLDLAT